MIFLNVSNGSLPYSTVHCPQMHRLTRSLESLGQVTSVQREAFLLKSVKQLPNLSLVLESFGKELRYIVHVHIHVHLHVHVVVNKKLNGASPRPLLILFQSRSVPGVNTCKSITKVLTWYTSVLFGNTAINLHLVLKYGFVGTCPGIEPVTDKVTGSIPGQVPTKPIFFLFLFLFFLFLFLLRFFLFLFFLCPPY